MPISKCQRSRLKPICNSWKFLTQTAFHEHINNKINEQINNKKEQAKKKAKTQCF